MSRTPRFRNWAVVGAAILLLLLLAQLVGGPEPPELDEATLNWLGQHTQGPIHLFLLQVYRMSGVAFTGCLVLAALVYLMLKRWWHDLGLLVLATGGILAIVDMWLKPLFDRARPHAKLLVVDGRSFPSGHAAGSVAFYLALGTHSTLHPPTPLAPLRAWGFLVESEDRIGLTRDGLLQVDRLLQEFFDPKYRKGRYA